jgi:hypothetical protein
MPLPESALRTSGEPPSHPRRRELLAALAAGTLSVAAGGVLTSAPASAATRTGPVTLDEFMELSRILTDREFSLDDEPGALYLASLVANPTFAAPLRQLVQDTVRAAREPSTFDEVVRSGALNSDAAAKTAQQILVLWYSGLVNDRTADYLEALAWETVPFAKPPSTELGFSKWDEAP